MHTNWQGCSKTINEDLILKKALITGLIALLGQTVFAQESNSYRFKNDQLGESLMTFKRSHLPKAQCVANSKRITYCNEREKVFGDMQVNAQYLFVDGNLASIKVGFDYWTKMIQLITEAMNTKAGKPASQIDYKLLGQVTLWENDKSSAYLIPHLCLNVAQNLNDSLMYWAKHMENPVNEEGCALFANNSEVLYIQKSLLSQATQAVIENHTATANKNKQDF